MTQIFGTAANETLTGTDGEDSFDGLGGNDKLIGGKGDDLYYAENFDGNRDQIFERAGGGFDWVVITGVDTHSFTLPTNVEGLANYGDYAGFTGIGNTLGNQMLGNVATDFLRGMAGNDQIDGGGGIDTLDGGAGNDELYDADGGDTLIGGSGNDTYFITATTKVTEAANGGTDLIWADFNVDLDNYANVENLRLAGTANLAAVGNALNNFITGNDGDNDLVGNGGNDTIDGSFGADTMAGGVGNDTYYVDDAGDVVLEGLGQGKDQVFASTSYQFTTGQEIEALTLTGVADIDAWGNDLANVITGNAGKNNLSGGFGTDTLIGGKGDDKYFLSVFDAADKIVEKAGEGYDEIDSSISVTLGANLEMLWLAHAGGDLDGTGNTLANTLIGNDGNNKLDGLAGNDVLDGLEGADTLLGGAGNDVMDGGAGVDLMVGGAGNDQYYVDNAFDVIVEQAGGGTLDSVVFAYAVAKVDLTQGALANLEVVTLLEDANTQVFGNARDNIINAFGGNDYLDGGAGNDLLRGRDGNDLLAGDAGNDVLNGGSGIDGMAGGAGNDTYIVDDQLDLVDETIGGGTDTVQSDVSFSLSVGDGQVFGGSVENLLLTGDADRIGKGNDLNNIIESGGGQDQLQGLGGNDILAGGAGDDQLKGGIGNDALYGGAGDDQLTGDAGNDKMIGGVGDDVYLVDSTGDKVTELAGEGQDTVIALVANYTLGANVENLGFFGPVGNAVGKGNTLDNIIVGADGDDKLGGAAGSDQLAGDNGNDKLVGGAGDDVLEGGLGFDTLDGGAGSDVFLYALDDVGNLAGLGGDVISSFEHGKDRIDVRDLFDDFGINTADPFASGHLIIDNTGVNAVLSFDPDGGGFGAAPVTLAIVGHIDLQASDVAF